MAIIFDPVKNAKNIAERGLSFELIETLEWDAALVKEDTRRNYGEVRLQVLGLLGNQLVMAVVTPRGQDLRVISLRQASKQEVWIYGQKDR